MAAPMSLIFFLDNLCMNAVSNKLRVCCFKLLKGSILLTQWVLHFVFIDSIRGIFFGVCQHWKKWFRLALKRTYTEINIYHCDNDRVLHFRDTCYSAESKCTCIQQYVVNFSTSFVGDCYASGSCSMPFTVDYNTDHHIMLFPRAMFITRCLWKEICS